MAGALEELIAHMPEGTNLFDFLEEYFISHIYPNHPAFDHGTIAMTVLCGIVVGIVLLSFTLRLRSTGIHWILRDSAMTRLDFRSMAPAMFGLFAAFEIILLTNITRCYHDRHWTGFVGGFQLLTLIPLVLTAHILLVNIVAQTPIVRKFLLGAGSLEHRGTLGVTLLAGLLAFLMAASTAAVLPPSILLARYTARQGAIADNIIAIIENARAANEPKLLAPLESEAVALAYVATRLKDAIRMAGVIFTVHCGLWVLGAIPYCLLLREVRHKIGRLERSLQEEEETRHTMTMLARKAEVKREFAQYGADRPFANLAAAEMPERYQVVLDSQLVEAASKVIRLRQLLKSDNVNHAIYLSMILVYASESIFQAAGAVDAVSPERVLPMLVSYNAAAFLLCGLPSVTLHLWDSWKLYRKSRSSTASNIRRRTVGDIAENVFNIPLHISTRHSTVERSAGGIQVTQSHHVVVETADSKLDSDDDKDSFRIQAL